MASLTTEASQTSQHSQECSDTWAALSAPFQQLQSTSDTSTSFAADPSCLMQAEEAVKQESAAKTTPSRPRPPTAVLGFAPPSPFSPATKPATGKYSWPANFFDDSRNKKVCQAADSEQESAAVGQHQDELVDTGAVSSHMGNGDSTAGDEQEKDFGAAWRDAAQSPPPHQSPALAAHDGASGSAQKTALSP